MRIILVHKLETLRLQRCVVYDVDKFTDGFVLSSSNKIEQKDDTSGYLRCIYGMPDDHCFWISLESRRQLPPKVRRRQFSWWPLLFYNPARLSTNICTTEKFNIIHKWSLKSKKLLTDLNPNGRIRVHIARPGQVMGDARLLNDIS